MHMFLGSGVKRKTVFLESRFIYADNTWMVVVHFFFALSIESSALITVSTCRRVTEKVI